MCRDAYIADFMAMLAMLDPVLGGIERWRSAPPSRDPSTLGFRGNRLLTKQSSFLRAERNLLESRGRVYNARMRAWVRKSP